MSLCYLLLMKLKMRLVSVVDMAIFKSSCMAIDILGILLACEKVVHKDGLLMYITFKSNIA